MYKIESYEIELLILNCEGMLDNLFCFDYIKKKFECYCKFCERLVCIDCIVELYNGYGYILEKLLIVCEKVFKLF